MDSGFIVQEYNKENEVEHLQWKAGIADRVFRSQIFDVYSIPYTRNDGRAGNYIKVSCPDWVQVCAIQPNSKNEDCLVMVRQFRHGCDQVALEVPGGVVNKNEDPAVAALRELYEETGFRAKKVTHIGSTSPNAAFMGNKLHVYLAKNLQPNSTRSLDKNEVIDVELVPIRLIETGSVPDFLVNGIMSIAWYYFSNWMKKVLL